MTSSNESLVASSTKLDTPELIALCAEHGVEVRRDELFAQFKENPSQENLDAFTSHHFEVMECVHKYDPAARKLKGRIIAAIQRSGYRMMFQKLASSYGLVYNAR